MPLFWHGNTSDTRHKLHQNSSSGLSNIASAEDVSRIATRKLPAIHSVALDDPHMALLIDEYCEREEEKEAAAGDGEPSTVLDTPEPLEPISLSQYREELFHPDRDLMTIASGSLVVGLGILMYYSLRFVSNVVIARMVDPITYGIYDEVIAVTVVCGWTAKLGLDNVLLRLVPEYRIRSQYGLIHGLFRFTLLLTLVVSGTMGAALFIFAPEISLYFYRNNSYVMPLRELAILIPLQAFQFLLACGLQSFKAIRWKMLIDRLLQPVITFLALMSLWFFRWNMETLSFATILGFVCTVGLGFGALIVIKRDRTPPTGPSYLPGYWLRIMLPMFMNLLLLGIIESTSMLLLGWLSSPLEVARYQNAERVGSFVSVPTTALCTAFAPRVVEYYSHQRFADLSRLYKAVTRWAFTLSLPLFLCILVFHRAILSTFGSYYTNVTPVMLMIALAQLIFSLLGPAGYLLTMVAQPRLILINSAIVSLIDFAMLLFLISIRGALGAGYAFALMMLTMYGLNFVQICWLLRMQPWSRDMYKPLLAGAAATLIGLSLLPLVNHGSHALLPLRQVMAMITFALSYALFVFLLRFSPEGSLVMAGLWRWLKQFPDRVVAFRADLCKTLRRWCSPGSR